MYKYTKINITRLQLLEDRAIKFIQTISKSTDEKLYAGNSGGKDSAILDYLLQLSGIEYYSMYNNTTIDPKGTIKHIRELYPHTEIIHPKESFYKLVERKGLPLRNRRFCCEVLKEYSSIGKKVFEGVRSVESNGRKNRDYIQCDTRKSQLGAQHIYPIYDWLDIDVWQYIQWKEIKLAPCYELGLHRLGCVGCCMVTKKGQRRKEFDLYPKVYIAIRKAITKGMLKNPQWKISCATDGNGELAMQWWLSGKTINEYFKHLYTFEKNKVGWIKTKTNEEQLSFLK